MDRWSFFRVWKKSWAGGRRGSRKSWSVNGPSLGKWTAPIARELDNRSQAFPRTLCSLVSVQASFIFTNIEYTR